MSCINYIVTIVLIFWETERRNVYLLAYLSNAQDSQNYDGVATQELETQSRTPMEVSGTQPHEPASVASWDAELGAEELNIGIGFLIWDVNILISILTVRTNACPYKQNFNDKAIIMVTDDANSCNICMPNTINT